MKKLFWLCAWSYTESQFSENMGFIRDISVEAADDLLKTNPKHWCLAYFKDCCESAIVDNNMSEVFNNWIKDARHKPIITMLEEIRRMVMSRIAKLANEGQRYQHLICPRIFDKLKEHISWTRNCHLIWNGLDGYEVTQNVTNEKGEIKEHTYVVNIRNRKCSCRVWNISGIPYAHAISAIFNKGEDPIHYVSDCFKKETHRAIYSHFMVPVIGRQDWPKTGIDPPLPPSKRKMPGRPKKHARREQGVVPKPSGSKMSRLGTIVKCSICRGQVIIKVLVP
jgi:hypothetical protein